MTLVTLDDSLTLLYETLRVACFPVGVRYRYRILSLSKVVRHNSNGYLTPGFYVNHHQ
ncbi:MAG: hypothetical protein V7K92_12030 [Nostoc sp.]|uniref:hypothetical protein n=1 Tax=Nostoc sp. TaxID=1180 RepID=UPI002FF27583